MSDLRYPVFLKMNNVIQDYAWGSKTSIQQLFNIANPGERPQAEIWMGVHPNGCSVVSVADTPTPLSDFITTNPEAILGTATYSTFGELPYLFKVLAAEKALSIQVHPSRKQAIKGFVKEEVASIPLSAANRNYKDPNYKPELVFALTPYTAMNGFRDIEVITTSFEQLDIEILAPLIRTLATQQHSSGLRAFFTAMLSLAGSEKEDAINGLIAYANKHYDNELYALILNLAEQYPNDIGIFSPLMLNVLTLSPGEAMFLNTCTPHAYIQGTGLEIMANSDNVLRAGLTPKHIDVDELVSNTRFESKPAGSLLLKPEVTASGQHYQIPVPDFSFSVCQQTQTLNTTSAEILFALDAPLTLTHDSGQAMTLKQGESVFIPAYAKSYQATTEGQFARAYN